MMGEQDYYDEDDLPEDEMPLTREAGWADALQAQFGSVPWWVISAVVHVIMLLLLSLIVVTEPREETSDVIIPMDLAEEPPEKEPPPAERKLFERERQIDMPDEVEHPVFARCGRPPRRCVGRCPRRSVSSCRRTGAGRSCPRRCG